MAEGDVYTREQIGDPFRFPEGTRFQQLAPLHRSLVRWNLETWAEGEATLERETFRGGPGPVGKAHVTPGGTIIIEAASHAEARDIAAYDSERLMDYDFIGKPQDESVVETHPLPLTADEQEAIGYGRCFFHVIAVVPEGPVEA